MNVSCTVQLFAIPFSIAARNSPHKMHILLFQILKISYWNHICRWGLLFFTLRIRWRRGPFFSECCAIVSHILCLLSLRLLVVRSRSTHIHFRPCCRHKEYIWAETAYIYEIVSHASFSAVLVMPNRIHPIRKILVYGKCICGEFAINLWLSLSGNLILRLTKMITSHIAWREERIPCVPCCNMCCKRENEVPLYEYI